MTQITKAQQAEAIRWIEEPWYWARKFGGEQFDPWSGQERFWVEYGKLLGAKIKRWRGQPLTEEEKGYARKLGISIMAGQGVGKGATISLCGYHYLFALQKVRPKVVCTAPAGPQLHSSLWPEFGTWLTRNPLMAEIFEKNSQRIFLKDDKDRGNVSRIEPRTVQPNANPDDQKVVLAGIHATGVMYQIDEASGVPEAVFEPIEGGLTDPLSMVILIFNPTRRTGFAIETHRKNRDMWICLQWDGEQLRQEKLANPGRFLWFNEDVQLELARKYGKDSDFYRVRVQGRPPNQSADTLIAFDDVMAATEREVKILASDPIVLAVDVGGSDPDGDASVVMPMIGPQVQRIYPYTEKNTMWLAQTVDGHVSQYASLVERRSLDAIMVDSNGIGRGVYDYLTSVRHWANVYPVNTAEKALDERRFHRSRDQYYWELREAFMDSRTISLLMRDPKTGLPIVDDELIGELTSIKWGEVDGKIKVQGKGLSSGIPGVPPLAKSPNKADTLAMAWYAYRHYCQPQMAKPREDAFAARRRRLRESMIGHRSVTQLMRV